MGFTVFEIDQHELSKHYHIRCDVKYWLTINKERPDNYTFIKKLFYIINGITCTNYYTEMKTSIPYIRIGDLSYKYDISDGNMMYLDEEFEVPDSKILKYNDLVLATIGATIGKIGMVKEFAGGTFSNNTVVLRLKDAVSNSPVFYEKLMQSDYMKEYIFGVVSQKAQPNLQGYDLRNIMIPNVPLMMQQQAVKAIIPIEQAIKRLQATIKPVSKIINDVFCYEFGFDLEKINTIDNNKIFDTYITTFKNEHTRFSYRWNQLLRIQNCMFENIKCIQAFGKYINSTRNGWSPECKENATIYKVLGIDSINKDGILTFDNVKFTDEKKGNIIDYIIHDNDFFVSRGNTTDLVALASIANIQNDDEYVFPDLMIKIDFDTNVLDKKYMSYVFNSFIGRLYFKYAAKGKNQTMVKVSQKELYDFLIPVPDKFKQQHIVNAIKAEIDRQDEIRQTIALERKKIDYIIESTIR